MKPVYIFFAFVAAAIIGTVSHELGHYAACCYYHVPAHISYAFTEWDVDLLTTIRDKAMANNNLAAFDRMMNTILVAGPTETLLTSALGFGWLRWLSKKSKIDAYNPAHLAAIMISLFCSREVLNALVDLTKFYLLKNTNLRNDEARIFDYYNIPQWLGQGSLLVMCTTLCMLVCFKLVQTHRKQLLIAGVAGSLAGFALWMLWLGPMLLPMQ